MTDEFQPSFGSQKLFNAKEFVKTMTPRCPENFQMFGMDTPKEFRDTLIGIARGPHHWVRVGTWKDIVVTVVPSVESLPYMDHQDMVMKMTDPQAKFMKTYVDRPIYECVYCLQSKQLKYEQELPKL